MSCNSAKPAAMPVLTTKRFTMKQRTSPDFTILALGLVLILALLAASCSSGDNKPDRVKARLQPTIYDAGQSAYKAWNNEVTVRYIDTSYRPGDVVELPDGYFIVLTTDSKSYSDYGLEIQSQDTMAVWDGNRLVGKIALTDDSEIGQLVLKDNE